MDKIESFTLDHNKVVAPYVRMAGVKELKGGGKVIKYDIRFTQPNVDFLPTATIHTIEHSLATALRHHTEGVIDISPMGCQTGFYVSTDSDVIGSREEFLSLLLDSMEEVLSYKEVPGATRLECGYAANHNLPAAKTALKEFLSTSEEELLSVFGVTSS